MNIQLTFRSIISLAYYLVLGFVLTGTRGLYQEWAVPVVAAGLGLFSLSVFFHFKMASYRLSSRSSFLLISLSLVLLSALMTSQPNIIYPQAKLLHIYFQISLLLTSFVLGAYLLQTLYFQASENTVLRWFILLLALFFYIRFFVLSLSPTPFIDVFTTCSLACDYLLSGQNPYIQSYPDIYNGAYSQIAKEQFGNTYNYVTAMQYGPLYIYLAAPFRLLHDIRLAQIAADALTLGALWRLGSLSGWNISSRVAVCLLWLVFPISLFVLEQSWIDPLLVAALAWAFCFLMERKFVFLGIALGVAFGIKHYGAMAAFFFVVYLLQQGQFKAACKISLVAAAVFLSAQLPFLWLNAKALIDSTWTSLLGMPPRADSLSLWAWIWDRFGQPPSKNFTLIISTFLISLVAWNLWRSAPKIGNLARALALAFSILFFLGYQAFCNYYYFVAFLIFMDFVFSLIPAAPEKSGDPSG